MKKQWMLAALGIGLRVVPAQAEAEPDEGPPPADATVSPAPEASAPVPAQIAAPGRLRPADDDAGPPTLWDATVWSLVRRWRPALGR